MQARAIKKAGISASVTRSPPRLFSEINPVAFVEAPVVYHNAPSFTYVIGDYTVSKTGTVSGPANKALIAALNAKGFIAE